MRLLAYLRLPGLYDDVERDVVALTMVAVASGVGFTFILEPSVAVMLVVVVRRATATQMQSVADCEPLRLAGKKMRND